MKKANVLKAVIVSLMITCTLPSFSVAADIKPVTAVPARDSAADARTLSRIAIRVNEIQNMDKTNLTSADKKALRNELKEMKTTAEGMKGGVYLSVGAIIIIILLLILIL